VREYYAVIFEDKDWGFVATFPDLPGCVDSTDSYAQAETLAAGLLGGFLRDIEAWGDSPPEPSTLAAIQSDPINASGIAVLVCPAAMAGPTSSQNGDENEWRAGR
jgi:predicted RNase H-like HicB family nuclease